LTLEDEDYPQTQRQTPEERSLRYTFAKSAKLCIFYFSILEAR
jgi:hypothetical protein